MNYKDDGIKTEEELKRIQNYLRRRGIKVTRTMITDAAIAIAKRLGAGDFTFYVEFAK